MKHKPEPRPPQRYLRSKQGQSAEVIRTTVRDLDGFWLYKLWYGDIMGNGRYTLAELLAWNVRWCKNKPADLKKR